MTEISIRNSALSTLNASLPTVTGLIINALPMRCAEQSRWRFSQQGVDSQQIAAANLEIANDSFRLGLITAPFLRRLSMHSRVTSQTIALKLKREQRTMTRRGLTAAFWSGESKPAESSK